MGVFHFFKLCKGYEIAQRNTYSSLDNKDFKTKSQMGMVLHIMPTNFYSSHFIQIFKVKCLFLCYRISKEDCFLFLVTEETWWSKKNSVSLMLYVYNLRIKFKQGMSTEVHVLIINIVFYWNVSNRFFSTFINIFLCWFFINHSNTHTTTSDTLDISTENMESE